MLKREEFTSPLEAKVLVEEYRQHYNNRRPHSALGYWTPSEFAVSCAPIAVSEEVIGEEHVEELESTLILS